MSVLTPVGASQVPSSGEVMVKARSENFPVAALVPGRRRRHLLALYGFARLVDDVGDEARGDRLAALAWVDDQLDRIYARRPVDHPVFKSLAVTVIECGLPEGPLRRLVEANRVDQRHCNYETFDDLLGYCRLSAAPVGELVLHVFGAASPERIARSDSVCAALQVIEHIQDVGEDYRRGRVYIPREDLARFGCEEEALGASATSEPLRGLIAFECGRAGALLDHGRALPAQLSGIAKVAVAGYIAGGRAALQAIERARYEVLAGAPRGARPAFAAAMVRALVGR